MTKAIPFEDKAAGWIDRLKGLDITTAERVGVLERLLISLAQFIDGEPLPEEWQSESFTHNDHFAS